MASPLYDPSSRDAQYGKNVAQYLLDLHDDSATFDFCGGMMFQLVLSDKLRNHLSEVAAAGAEDSRQPVVQPAETFRMAFMPGYAQNAEADNIAVFHGREVRKVPDAAGGMGFVLQLSFAGDEDKPDPEGWSRGEVSEYSGWLSDSQRRWRNGDILEEEGVQFKARFGPEAFTLHHRCYLHLDGGNAMWLSAEDGCEGTPAALDTLRFPEGKKRGGILASFF